MRKFVNVATDRTLGTSEIPPDRIGDDGLPLIPDEQLATMIDVTDLPEPEGGWHRQRLKAGVVDLTNATEADFEPVREPLPDPNSTEARLARVEAAVDRIVLAVGA